MHYALSLKSAVAFSFVGNIDEAVFYNQLSAYNGAMTNSGDKNSGVEGVSLKLDQLVSVQAIVFVLSAYKFGNLKYCESAYVTVKDSEKEIHSLNVGGMGFETTGSLMAIMFKHPGWFIFLCFVLFISLITIS